MSLRIIDENIYLNNTVISKKTFLDTIGEKLPIGTSLSFLDKTLSGGGTKYSRAVDRLRSDFSKMKEDDPKYQKTKN